MEALLSFGPPLTRPHLLGSSRPHTLTKVAAFLEPECPDLDDETHAGVDG